MYYNLNTINMKKAGRIISLCMAMATSFTPVMAQQGPKPESSLNNPLALTLVVIIAALALVIGMLAYVVYGAAEIELKKQQKQKADSSAKNVVSTIVLFLLTATIANAQNASEPVAQTTIGGLSSSVFYILLAILLIEITAIFFLLFQLRFLIGIERRKVIENEEKQTSIAREPVEIKLNWWDRFNKFRPVEQEANIDLGHNYDGIRELDNRLPPWWLYGFYITIIFAAVYLYRTHISHAAPSSAEEYQAAVTKANAQMEGRLKDQKNRVDENTVVLLTEKTELEKGKAVFASYCIACHGQLAQGTVGPNLTDDYWIHGGNIKDIFKTIKYGYPEKSMQSWKDQLTPVQIAQVSSYIKSLRGSNPAGAKEKQGELYEEK